MAISMEAQSFELKYILIDVIDYFHVQLDFYDVMICQDFCISSHQSQKTWVLSALPVELLVSVHHIPELLAQLFSLLFWLTVMKSMSCFTSRWSKGSHVNPWKRSCRFCQFC